MGSLTVNEIEKTTKDARERFTQMTLPATSERMIMAKNDKYNRSGCLDMTAYIAMKNIEREEATKKKAENAGKKKRPYKGGSKKKSGK